LVLLTLLHHFNESLKHLLNGLEGRHFMLALLILMVSPFLPMHETNSLQCITHDGFMNRIDTHVTLLNAFYYKLQTVRLIR